MTRPRRPPEGPRLRPAASRKVASGGVGAGVGDAGVVELVPADRAARHGRRGSPPAAWPGGSPGSCGAWRSWWRGPAGRPWRGGCRRRPPGRRRGPCSRRTRHGRAGSRRSRRRPARKRAAAARRAGVQFRVAAGQPAGVAPGGRGLVRERGERDDLGPGGAPACEQVGVDEGEGGVLTPGRCAGRAGGRPASAPEVRQQERGGGGEDGVEVQAALRHVGQACRAAPEGPRARRPGRGRGGARAGRGRGRAGGRRGRAGRWRRWRRRRRCGGGRCRRGSGRRRRCGRRGRGWRSRGRRRRRSGTGRTRPAPAARAGRSGRRGRRRRRSGRGGAATPSNRPMADSITSSPAPCAAPQPAWRAAAGAWPRCPGWGTGAPEAAAWKAGSM